MSEFMFVTFFSLAMIFCFIQAGLISAIQDRDKNMAGFTIALSIVVGIVIFGLAVLATQFRGEGLIN